MTGKRKNTTKKMIDTSFAVLDDEATASFTISEFLNFMPAHLSWSNNKSIFHLKVFWRPHLESQPNCLQNPPPSYELIKKIQSSLQLIDTLRFPTLVQFWAPITTGGQRLLVTSDFPFGLSSLHKRLCSLRKHCFGYCYNIDKGNGPPGRVFLHGFPEFTPNVACYLNEEYALRDQALQCGAWGYLALPVFESQTPECVGVLEFVTIMDGSYSLSDQVGKISDVLEKVGLKCTNGAWPVNIEKSRSNGSKKCPLTEIEEVLEVVCNRHKLPFAQTWVPLYGERAGEIMMFTSEKGSYMSAKTVLPFQKDCLHFPLRKGEGPSWAAFSSKKPSFCKDVGQLSVAKYRLALSARKVKLQSCFAICMQSIHSDDLYVLELYLPSRERTDGELFTFLASIFESLKQHLRSFKIGFEEESEGKLSVEVIGKSTNTFVICNPNSLQHKGNEMQKNFSDVPVKVKVDDTEQGQIGDHVKITERTSSPVSGSPSVEESHESLLTIKATYEDDMIKFYLPLSSGMSILEDGVIKRLKLERGIFKIEYLGEENRRVVIDNDIDLRNHLARMKSLGKTIIYLFISKLLAQSESSVAKTMTIKATYKDDMIKFELSLTSGMMALSEEVVKRLKLEVGSFETKYRADGNLITLSSDEDLRNLMKTVHASGQTTLRLLIEEIVCV